MYTVFLLEGKNGEPGKYVEIDESFVEMENTSMYIATRTRNCIDTNESFILRVPNRKTTTLLKETKQISKKDPRFFLTAGKHMKQTN